MKKDPLIFVEHVLESIETIERFVEGLNKENFIGNKLKQNAIIRELEVIGEAVKNVPVYFREKYPAIEWVKIAGLRDKLIHTYFEVDLDLVWEIVKRDVPKLKEAIKEILAEN